MFRPTYDALFDKFTAGRTLSANAWRGAHPFYESRIFGEVSIPDLLELYHKRSKTAGILTHIGEDRLGIRCYVTGQLVEDSYKLFYPTDGMGAPVDEKVLDKLGAQIDIGNWVAFATKSGDMFVGVVVQFTPVGAIMLEVPYGEGYGKIQRARAVGGSCCVVLRPDHLGLPERIAGYEEAKAKASA